MDRRDRNQVEMKASRIEMTHGMIRDLVARGESTRETLALKDDLDQYRSQEIQPFRVFGAHSEAAPPACVKTRVYSSLSEQSHCVPVFFTATELVSCNDGVTVAAKR